MKTPLQVWFLAAEADPFIKVGGLGDVAGSLPPALSRLGVDVRLVLPLHGEIRRKEYALIKECAFQIPYQDGNLLAEAFALRFGGLPVYFIGGPLIPRDGPIYSGDNFADGLKYLFFSVAALYLIEELSKQPFILHANDWHTSLAIYALDKLKQKNPDRWKNATVLGIHNLPYLGGRLGGILERFGLSPAKDARLPAWAQDLPLPLGLLTADRIVAVSPTYAREILTPEYGSGLHDFLSTRASRLTGILNGLDLNHWNPAADPHLIQQFTPDTLENRAINRSALQNELDLPVDHTALLIGMVNRMDYQKGIDLVPEALAGLPALLPDKASNWQMVILGTGDPIIENKTRWLELEYPGRVRVVTRFDPRLSRLIYGGADLMLIPSRYEPCGLTQMIAMRYGCVPLGRATGGLKDTIIDYNQSRNSTGFLFTDPISESLQKALIRAIQVYQDKTSWKGLQSRGMQQDFSWDRSAREYRKLYQALNSSSPAHL